MADVLSELEINPIIYAKGRLKNTPYYNNSPIIVDTFYIPESVKTVKLDIKITDKQNFEALKGKERVLGQFGIPFTLDSCFFVIKRVMDEKDQKLFIINFKKIDIASQDFLGKLTVTPIKGTGGTGNAISISMEDEFPVRGVDIVNKLIETYNRSGIEDKNSGDKNALAFIDNRVQKLTDEVNSGEKDIESYKKTQGIIADATSGINYGLGKLGASDNKITELEIKKAILNSLAESLATQNSNNDFSLMPANLVENNPSIAFQATEYNKLILERLRLLKYAKKENTAVILLENQIQDTRKIIKDNINTALNNLKQEITVALPKFKAEYAAADQELLVRNAVYWRLPALKT
jgi:tyrosine-protein kinase Etk/Wzc